MVIGTAIGIDQKEYSRAKLKLIGNRCQEEIIHNMSAIIMFNVLAHCWLTLVVIHFMMKKHLNMNG